MGVSREAQVSSTLRQRGFGTGTSLMPSQSSLSGSTAFLATLESVPAPRLPWTPGRTVCGTRPLRGRTRGGITRRGTAQPGTQCQPGRPGQSGRALLTSGLPYSCPKESRLIARGSCELGTLSVTPRSSEQNVRIESTEHPGGDACLPRSSTWREVGFPFHAKRLFTTYPLGTYTKSSASHPQTRAQGQGETFKCK